MTISTCSSTSLGSSFSYGTSSSSESSSSELYDSTSSTSTISDSVPDQIDKAEELVRIKKICGEDFVNKIGEKILLRISERNMSSYNLVGGFNHTFNKISAMDGTSVCRTIFSLPISYTEKTDFFGLCFKLRRKNNKTGEEIEYIQSIAGTKVDWFYRESSNGPSSKYIPSRYYHGAHNIPASALFNDNGLSRMSENTMKKIAQLLHGKTIEKTCCGGSESYSYNIPSSEITS